MCPNRQSGFTLLEVMIAAVVLGVAMLTLMLSLTASLEQVESIRNYNTARGLLSMKLAEIEQNTELEEMMEDGEFENHPGFTWEYEVTETELNDLYEVVVTVRWTERGEEVSEEIVTFLYRSMERPRKLGDATRKPGQPAQPPR